MRLLLWLHRGSASQKASQNMTDPSQQPTPSAETPTAAASVEPAAAAPAKPAAPTPKSVAQPSRFDKRPPRGDGGKPGFRRERPAPRTESVPQLETRDYSKPSLRQLDKEIEGELQAAMSGLSNQEMYGDLSANQQAAEGGPKKGRVLRVRGSDVFVEVPGGRSEGLISMDQFPEGPPAIGTEIDIHIEGYDRANGLLILTRKGAAVHADWSSIAEGMIVEARVTGTNKGGLEVDVNGIRGFMPISQIDLYRVEDTTQFINQRLRCVVQDVNPAERNLVVSRRTLLEKEREENRERLWNELAEGQVRDGVVRSVKDFGAFVELGGVDGLVHVSEMSWTRVQDATKVLQPGQAVKVVVLKVDRERRKLSLGMKQLQESPWESAVQKYIPSTVVTGKVTRLMEFGAFVELEPGIEGLIHISELAPTRVRRVKDFVQPDQVVQVMVLSVDPEQRRISLSLKGALPKEAPPVEEEEEEAGEVKPIKPRTTPLRGGIGQQWSLPGQEEAEEEGSP
jgi:ribosomal protein S1